MTKELLIDRLDLEPLATGLAASIENQPAIIRQGKAKMQLDFL
jgi:hypothetical protein